MDKEERVDKWSSATFRITSLTLSTAEIMEALDTPPSRAWERGSPVSLRNPDGPRRDVSIWTFDSDLSDTEPLDAHIMRLIEFIERRLDALKALQSCCDFDICCAFASGNGQGGFTLESGTLLRLTLLPIDLIVSLYPPEARETKDDHDAAVS